MAGQVAHYIKEHDLQCLTGSALAGNNSRLQSSGRLSTDLCLRGSKKRTHMRDHIQPSWTRLPSPLWITTGVHGDEGRHPFVLDKRCFFESLTPPRQEDSALLLHGRANTADRHLPRICRSCGAVMINLWADGSKICFRTDDPFPSKVKASASRMWRLKHFSVVSF